MKNTLAIFFKQQQIEQVNYFYCKIFNLSCILFSMQFSLFENTLICILLSFQSFYIFLPNALQTLTKMQQSFYCMTMFTIALHWGISRRASCNKCFILCFVCCFHSQSLAVMDCAFDCQMNRKYYFYHGHNINRGLSRIICVTAIDALKEAWSSQGYLG